MKSCKILDLGESLARAMNNFPLTFMVLQDQFMTTNEVFELLIDSTKLQKLKSQRNLHEIK